MAAVEVPPKRTLCFLSTLLPQKVPEKSDVILRCIIAGQPEPEVSWYKNGQAISEGDVSSYEFFENQYTHVLRLYCCTRDDAAVYQVSARNSSGMICCSAHIEVEGTPETLQCLPDQKDAMDAGWKCETGMPHLESTEMDEKGHPYEENPRISPCTPESACSSCPKLKCSDLLQFLTNSDSHLPSSEKPLDVKKTRQTPVTDGPDNTAETAEGVLFANSSNTPERQDGNWPWTMHIKPLQPTDGALGQDSLHDGGLDSSHQHPRVQKYISSSRPLSESASSICPGDSAPCNVQLCPQVSSEDSDSDYELCPEITLTYTEEEFSDDDLEYLECSDVMTDYSNAVWQRHLRGTDCVFLLDSDDEELEFTECGLDGCGHFLSEMGCWCQVSDDTGPMDATPGLCGHHSPPQEAGGRSREDSSPGPSSLQAGMTLTLGPHQDGTSKVTDPGRDKLPSAAGAAENVYPGIQGETRDNHQAEEETVRDDLLGMEKAPAEMAPGGVREGGTHQLWGTPAGKGPGGKDLLTTRGSQKPVRARRLGTKGAPRKLITPLKENAAGSHLNLHPRDPAKHPLTQSDKKERCHTRATPGPASQVHAEECDLSPQAEQEAKTSQISADWLPYKGENACPKVDKMQFNGQWEASQTAGHSRPPQVKIRQVVWEQVSLSPRSASAKPVVEESPLNGTRAREPPDIGGVHMGQAALAQELVVECCVGSRGHEEQEDSAGYMPGGPLGDLERELSISEADGESICPCEHPVPHSQDGHVDPDKLEAPSVASPEPSSIGLSLGDLCVGPNNREAVGGTEGFESGDRGTCVSTDSPAGTPVDTYLPQDMRCLGLDLEHGLSRGADLYSPDDKTLEALGNTQSSEPTPEHDKDKDSAVPPLFINTFTWKMSARAMESVTGSSVAEVKATSTLACVKRTEQDRLSSSGGVLGSQLLPSEDSSSLQTEEGGEACSSTNAKHNADTPPSLSSIVTFPQETPISPANTESLLILKNSEDTAAINTGAKVHQTKYLAASVAENNQASCTEESSPRELDEDTSQLPSRVLRDHILNDPTAESIKELPYMVPSAPGNHVCAPQLLVGGAWSESPLQTGHHTEGKSQTMDRAEHRSLEENFQEKGSETKQTHPCDSLSHQGSLSEDGFQEILPTASAAQEEIDSVSLDQSPGNFRDELGQSSGLGMSISVQTETIMEEESQARINVQPLSEYLLVEPKEGGAGDPGHKLKIITLEAPIAESWSPRQLTDYEYKESEAVPRIPDRILALPDILKTDALVGHLHSSEKAAPARGAQWEFDSTLAQNIRETQGWQEPASSDDGRRFSSQNLSPLRPLGSSVDPVDDKELHPTDLLSEASRPGGKRNAGGGRKNQEGNQAPVDPPSFLKQLLSSPQILESSVDPIDGAGAVKSACAELPGPPNATVGLIKEEAQLKDGDLGQHVEAQPTTGQVLYPKKGRESAPRERSINRNQEDSTGGQAERSKNDKAKVQPATPQVSSPDEGWEMVAPEGSVLRVQEGRESSFGEAAQSKPDDTGVTAPTLSLSGCLAVKTQASVGDDTSSTGQIYDATKKDVVEPGTHQHVFSVSKERGLHTGDEHVHYLSSSNLTVLSVPSCSEGNSTNFSISNRTKEPNIEEPHNGETQPPNSTGSPVTTWASISGECTSENTPKFPQDLCQQGPAPGSTKKPEGETPSRLVTKLGKLPGARPAVIVSEETKKKQDSLGSGHIAEGVKKKILSRVAALRLKLEEKENVRKNSNFLKKIPKLETSVSRTDEKKDHKKPPYRREGKAPVLLKKIQAEMFPDHSGNVRLSCQFAEIDEDSTILWTKDAKSIAHVQRSAGDHSTVFLAIAQAGQKDQGHYCCCIKNSYGKATADFNLTAEVLKQLSGQQDIRECEEIEFSQLIFREDFLKDSYFGSSLRGQIATEELHFGEGVHRKAFRSTVMHGLTPVFKPGHACVLKVHNAIAYGTRNNDELVQKNYKLAAQECYVQNTARHYAKIYAAEAQPLEGFGEVPEIIPIFLIHRPENNIPYATVEEELIGEFVKYSIRDGKEINFLRRESEAGQKCCTFQHWVYQKTSGCLLVTDMQGVGMKLTDVGIATLAKGYKGFKGNCSMTFIDQFKALHQCNKYCKMLGLKALQNNNQKQKKPSVVMKSKVQPNSTTVKKAAPGTPAEKKT